MPNNEVVVVDNWKNDLKREAVVAGKKLANMFLNDAKEPVSEYAAFFVKRIIEHLLFQLNE